MRILVVVFAVVWLSVSAYKIILRGSMDYVYLQASLEMFIGVPSIPFLTLCRSVSYQGR